MSVVKSVFANVAGFVDWLAHGAPPDTTDSVYDGRQSISAGGSSDGVFGFENLGNTCFLNCILQVFRSHWCLSPCLERLLLVCFHSAVVAILTFPFCVSPLVCLILCHAFRSPSLLLCLNLQALAPSTIFKAYVAFLKGDAMNSQQGAELVYCLDQCLRGETSRPDRLLRCLARENRMFNSGEQHVS